MKYNLYKLYGSWFGKSIFTLSLLFTLLSGANAQTQLVKWDFSSYTNTPTSNLPQNSGKLVTAVGQNQAAFVSAVGLPYDPPYICNGWDVPANTAYFLINFNTQNYASNTISYFLGAFQFGVKSFQPQYSVSGVGGPWIDFGTAVTFPAAGGDQMFTNVPLPAACDNQVNVWVRLLSTTTTFNNGGDYIDEIEVNGNIMVPLPVSITDFNVQTENNNNLVSWVTETETNNSHFDIQRGTNANDFMTIASIPSKAMNGSSSARLNYSYVDMQPGTGHNYYRLQQTDINGRSVYSNILNIVNVATGAGVKVYPNPAKEVLHIEVYAENKLPLTVTLTDIHGTIMKKISSEVSAGVNHIVTDMKTFVPGIYTLQVYRGNSLIHTQKVNH